MLRGIEPESVHFYREVKVTEGSPLSSGTTVLVGVQLARAHRLKVGDTLSFERSQWTIGGLFEADGAFYEQEVWVDLDALSAAANRTEVTSFMVRCNSIADTQVMVDAINSQRTEPLLAMTSTAAFKRVGGMSIWMAALGQFIAMLIALGAVFGGMNTMYAAVATRSREIGILRAIGFRSGAVLLSMWLESMMVGMLGGLAGVLLAFAMARVPLNMPFLLERSVTLHTGDVVAGLVLALIVGGLGGLLPSLQAARVNVVDALR